ncbi:hypothetical protein CMV_000293 [Castanea mollissima]|uniref:Uncharacterized protein n=1 Tax=Castanea mollissima TaxID=60419 RepID=A0A8J4RX31_9ROSI|nr:hypothetical protein CMV_000293 [Castanea mollissima]
MAPRAGRQFQTRHPVQNHVNYAHQGSYGSVGPIGSRQRNGMINQAIRGVSESLGQTLVQGLLGGGSSSNGENQLWLSTHAGRAGGGHLSSSPTNEEEEEEEEEEDGYDPVTCVLSRWITTSSDQFFFCNFDSGKDHGCNYLGCLNSLNFDQKE